MLKIPGEYQAKVRVTGGVLGEMSEAKEGPSERYAMEWSAGWLQAAISPTWRIIMDFEEEGVKVARTTVDCIPNDALLVRMQRRIAQGLPSVAQGLIWEAAREAADAIRFQVLNKTGRAENRMLLGSPEGEAAAVIISTTRLVPYDGTDKILYLKEIGRIVVHLHREAQERLSDVERERVKGYGRELSQALTKRRQKPKPVNLVLSSDDPIHFYIDESGDVGFEAGSSDYYTVAFFAIRASAESSVREQLKELLNDCMPPGNKEIKFGKVDKYRNTSRREKIYGECVRILNEAPLTLYATAVHKDGFVYEKVRSMIAIYHFEGGELPDLKEPLSVERMKDYPKEMLQAWGASTLPMIMLRLLIEAGSTGRIYYDEQQWEWKNDLLKEGFREVIALLPRAAEVFFGVKCAIDLPLKFVDSKEEPLIWLSELAAREVNKLLLGMHNRVDEIREKFAGAGPYPEGHYLSLVDQHGRYTFYNLDTKRVDLVLPD